MPAPQPPILAHWDQKALSFAASATRPGVLPGSSAEPVSNRASCN